MAHETFCDLRSRKSACRPLIIEIGRKMKGSQQYFSLCLNYIY